MKKCYDWFDKSSTSCSKKGHLHFVCEKWIFQLFIRHIDNVSKNKVKEALSHHTLHHYACSKGRIPIVEYLIEKESYIKAKAQCQRTPLHNSCEFGHLQIVEYLTVSTIMGKKNAFLPAFLNKSMKFNKKLRRVFSNTSYFQKNFQ